MYEWYHKIALPSRTEAIHSWIYGASHLFMRMSGFIVILHSPILKEESLSRKCKAQGEA